MADSIWANFYFYTSFFSCLVEEMERNCLEVFNWQAYLNLQARAQSKSGGSKNSSSFLKATTTTFQHTINVSEKSSYVAHINSYLAEDSFLKKYLPLDPSTNALFDLAKDGVLLWSVCENPLEILYILD